MDGTVSHMLETSREARVRWGAAALFLAGFLVAAQTFYWNGSSSTDENLFTDAPSGVLVGAGPADAPRGASGPTATCGPAISCWRVDGAPVRDPSEVRARLARGGGPMLVKLRAAGKGEHTHRSRRGCGTGGRAPARCLEHGGRRRRYARRRVRSRADARRRRHHEDQRTDVHERARRRMASCAAARRGAPRPTTSFAKGGQPRCR